MKLLAVLGGVAAAVVLFFAVIFAMAASYDSTRLITSAILFLIGLIIIAGVYYITRKPKTVIQQLELSGKMHAAQLKCPHCNANIDASQIQIRDGVPYVKCPYCGTTFEVAEEPKW